MDTRDLKIVCYTGGTCGDLITAMIDDRDSTFYFKAVMHDKQRQRLKKPLSFANDEEKDDYLQQISEQYNSIPSHDLDYHIKRKHEFIAITVEDPKVALWAAHRFKKLHRPHVWQEMQKACGATTVEDYAEMLRQYSNMVKQHTDKLIRLESIRQGRVIDELQSVLSIKVDRPRQNLYRNWLLLQSGF
jgi:hypothetical protein